VVLAIAHPEPALDDLRNPSLSPEVAGKAMGFCAFEEEVCKLAELLRG